jgi:hypothetical protein
VPPKAQPEEPKKAPSPSTPPTQAQAPAPSFETIPGTPLGKKTVTVDLSEIDKRFRATIDIPEGGKVTRQRDTFGGKKYEWYDVRVQYGEGTGFDAIELSIKIEKAPLTTLDETKEVAEGVASGLPVKTLEVAADRYFVERGDADKKPRVFYVRRDLTVSGVTYSAVHGNRIVADGNRAVADALWKAAQSLRQTDDQKKKEAARAEAIKKLEALGGKLREQPTLETTAYLPDVAAMDEAIAALKGIPDLQGVSLSDVPEKFQKSVVKSVGEIAGVRSLELFGNWVTDEQLTQVPDRIANLLLSKSKVSDQGVTGLARLKNLRSLEIRYVDVTDAILPPFAAVKPLEYLEVKYTNVTEPAVGKLKEQRKDLEVSHTAK